MQARNVHVAVVAPLALALALACEESGTNAGAGASAEPAAPLVPAPAPEAHTSSESASSARPSPSAAPVESAADETHASGASGDESQEDDTKQAKKKKEKRKKRHDGKGDTTIEVVEAGSEPRSALRYTLSTGTKQSVRVLMKSTMSMELSGFKNPAQSMPEVEMKMEVAVLALSADRVATRRIRIMGIDLADEKERGSQVGAAVTGQLGALVGLEGVDEMNDRGVVLGAELDSSKIKDQSMKAMTDSTQRTIAQMGVTFPVEPVGLGAKWKATTGVAQFGVKLTQVATYELVSMEGRRGKMSVALDQSAPRGQINIPGVPKSTFSELVSMHSSGKGTIEFDLDQSVPKGTLEMNVTSKAKGELRGQVTDVVTHLTYAARFEVGK